MKYKVGDKVRVRTDLVVDRTYGDGVLFRSGMVYYEGRVVTISEVGDCFYKIKEDSPYNWSWVDEMFEDVSDDEKFHDAFVKMLDFAKEHLSKEEFNEFVYKIYICGIENVYVEEIPVYENIEYNGCVLWKRIKGVEYKIECNQTDIQEKLEHDKVMQDFMRQMRNCGWIM